MDTESAPRSSPQARELHPLEVKVLLHAREGAEITQASLISELAYNTGQANQALSWLAAKGFAAEKSRATRVLYEITDFGRECLDKGTYEERILRLLSAEGPHSLPEIARKLGVDPKDVGSAFGGLSKERILSMDDQKRATLAGSGTGNGSSDAVRALLSKAAQAGALDER
ncbi:MAG TPA: phenylalanine--tRNA ligase subunit alpha, partial [Spirochaetia bacterium]|nr:phenylalanine--tRNA ligase subunit alpha [Spirochaetia bacterium]